MAFTTILRVQIVDFNSNPKAGVIVKLTNPNSEGYAIIPNSPSGSQISSASTEGGGWVIFSGLSASNYNISVSGVGSIYTVNNSYTINPDSIPFESRTFIRSSESISNIETQNQLVQAGTLSGVAQIAPNVIDDFTGGVRTSTTTPSFYNYNTSSIILWSGTNVGKQYNNMYFHSNQNVPYVQTTQIKVKI